MAKIHKSQLVRVDGQSFPISDLTEFGFAADASFPSNTSGGELVLGSVEIDVEFAARHKSEPLTYYHFLNRSPENREKFKQILTHLESETAAELKAEKETNSAPTAAMPLAAVAPPVEKNEKNEEKQLAERKVLEPVGAEAASVQETNRITPSENHSNVPKAVPLNSRTASSNSVKQSRRSESTENRSDVSRIARGDSNAASKKSSKSKKWLLILPLLLGAGFLLAKFWPGGGGNRVAITPSVQGTITQVLVDRGATVKEGDLLLQLGEQPPESQVAELKSQLEASQIELEAVEKSLAVHREKMQLITDKRVLELKAAKAEVAIAAEAKLESKKTIDRIRPYKESGAVSQVEFEEIEMVFIEANGKWVEKSNLVEKIQFAIKAAESNILVEAQEVNDELAQLEIQYELALAKHAELEKQVGSKQPGQTVNIYAPCDGKVSKIENQVGDFVKSDARMLYLEQSR